MATYSVTFLSRDDRGRFERRHTTVPAEDPQEVVSWVRHGDRNGKWSLEGDIRIRGPIGTAQCEQTTVPN